MPTSRNEEFRPRRRAVKSPSTRTDASRKPEWRRRPAHWKVARVAVRWDRGTGDPEPSFFPGSLRKEGKPKVPCQEVGEGKPRSRPGGPSRGCVCEETASVEPGGGVFSCVQTVQRCSRPAGECAPRLARFRQLTWPRHSVSIPRGPGAALRRARSHRGYRLEKAVPTCRWRVHVLSRPSRGSWVLGRTDLGENSARGVTEKGVLAFGWWCFTQHHVIAVEWAWCSWSRFYASIGLLVSEELARNSFYSWNCLSVNISQVPRCSNPAIGMQHVSGSQRH
jgi:hypothetical protein